MTLKVAFANLKPF